NRRLRNRTASGRTRAWSARTWWTPLRTAPAGRIAFRGESIGRPCGEEDPLRPRELVRVGVAELREHLVQTAALGGVEGTARLLLEHVEQVDRPARLLQV